MELSPYVRFAMHHVWLENNYINRSIWDHEIIFIDHGSMKLTVDGKVYYLKENDVILLRPDQNHILEYNGEVCYQPHVHFDFVYEPGREKVTVSFLRKDLMSEEQLKLFQKDFCKENNINIPIVFQPKNPMKIKNLLFEIIDEYTYKKSNSDIILKGLLMELIGFIFRENSHEKDSPTMQQLDDIIIFMNENVDKNLPLSAFSNRMHVSDWSLIRLFNENCHCSPIKYYNKLKYLRAKELLQYSLLSITEISIKMNYQDPQTFSRWFKEMDGNYPSAFRNQRK